MNYSRENKLLFFGVVITVAYVIFLIFIALPIDQFKHFILAASFNEKGDFLAGVFGPIAFLWLVLGYFMQSKELKLQRQEIISQNQLLFYELELQKKIYEPRFHIEEIEERKYSIQNVGKYAAQKVSIFYVSHEIKKQWIVAMTNCLVNKTILEFEINEPNPIPDMFGEKSEILVNYDTQLDEIRFQRFGITKNTDTKTGLGWQLQHSNDAPEYYSHYT